MPDEPADIQLSWHDAAWHLWATDHRGPVPSPALFVAVHGRVGFHPMHVGSVVRLPMDLPSGADTVATVRLRPVDAVEALAERRTTFPAASDAMLWYRAVMGLADAVVRARRVRPVVAHHPPRFEARWHVVADDAVTVTTAGLAASMPPAVRAAGAVDVGEVLEASVDALVRRRLGAVGWRPQLSARGAEQRATKAVFLGLGGGSPAVLHRLTDHGAIVRLGHELDREADRLQGLPTLVVHLRLAPPDERAGADPDAPWRLTLEVADADDASRWCTARDADRHDESAVRVAAGAQHVERVVEHLREVAGGLAQAVPEWEGLHTLSPGEVELDIAQVEGLLGDRGAELERLDIALVGPEQLLRADATIRGRATPAPPAVTGSRFGAEALVEWSATVDGAAIDDDQLRRAVEAGTSLLHVNGRWVRLDPGQLQRTAERLARHRADDARVDASGLLRLAAAVPTGAAGTGEPASIDAVGWAAELLAGLPDESMAEAVEPPGFTGTLRHYQRRGLGWLGFLSRLGLGGCLADDMGLGKTATALAHLATLPGPHLVVCPLSVVHNWQVESGRFTPLLRVLVRHGAGRRDGQAASNELANVDVVITTYGTLARDLATLGALEWGTVVLDEAQAVKNHHTQAAKAVRELRARQKVALTGTPVENRLSELWAILDVANPGLLGSFGSFHERFAKPIERHGDADATGALRTLTQPFVLRRTKADRTLLPELPDKVEQLAFATLTREQATMYQAVVQQLLSDADETTGIRRRGIVLAALTRLKQICNHPAHALGDGSRLAGRSGKLTRFDELVDELVEAGERALVFTQYREMGILLQRHLLDRSQMHAPFLHGGVARGGRDGMVRRFQDGEGPPLLLVSLKAGGTGLNLTAASRVIHYDRWWNPAVEDQATDRAWRLGQRSTVFVHKLVCEGTVEERIGQLIDDKRQLAASVLGGQGEAWLSELSTAELRSLIALQTPAPPREGGRR